MEKKLTHIAHLRSFHIAVLIMGTCLLLTGAFHGNIWFDESYSVGIASKSFADIWRIGSGDVHPVLYYWALHVIHLAGGGIDAYRVFSVFGSVAMAALGYTHLRRDFGWRVGVLFTFFALFLPYVSYLCIEIRMYSWSACMVMLAWIYAFRIARNKLDGRTTRTHARTGYWICFTLSSLAAAYLHYFGVLSAFLINAGLLVFLIRHRHQRKHDLTVFIVQAVAQVMLYVPWLFALASQLGVVSNTYWVKFHFPDTLIGLLRYPVFTMQIDFAWFGDYGIGPRILVTVIVVLAALLAVFLVLRLRRYRKHLKARLQPSIRQSSRWKRAYHMITCPENMPIVLGFGTYLGLFVLAAVASLVMHSLMLYFRYMFCAIGPLLFATVYLLRRIGGTRVIMSACALLLSLSILNQLLIVHDDYSPDNQAATRYLAENVNDGNLVLSSDIGIEGVTAIELPEIHQCYLNWQRANWALAYEAYAPTLETIPGWETKLDGYTGTFWVLGTSSDGSRPNDVNDLLQKDGVRMLSSEVFYRPYERTYFTVTLMAKGPVTP